MLKLFRNAIHALSLVRGEKSPSVSLRAESLAMSIGGILGGLVAGIVGAAAWCAVAYYANLEIGYLAWGIGGLVGLAVAACGRSPGPAAGVLAVALTILSIVAGKYATVEVMIQKEFGEAVGAQQFAPEDFEEPALIAMLARRIAADREEQGQPVAWPEVDEDDADLPVEEIYPAGIWSEASRDWSNMDAQAQGDLRQELSDDTEQAFGQMRDLVLAQVRQGGFFESFGVMDLVFFGLAIATAWGIANNQGE